MSTNLSSFKMAGKSVSEIIEKSVQFKTDENVRESDLLGAFGKVGVVEELKFVDNIHGYCIFEEKNNVRAAIQFVENLAKLDATGHRWLAALMTYNFSIEHRPEKRMGDADGLYRLPKDYETTDKVGIQNIYDMCEARFKPMVESLSMRAESVPDTLSHPPHWPGTESLPQISNSEWVEYQRADKVIERVRFYQERGSKPSVRERSQEDPEVLILLREWERLGLNEDILCRMRMVHGKTTFQLVLPKLFRDKAMLGLHDHVGHPGIDRTVELVRERFYWPKMSQDVARKVKTCDRCIRRKIPPDAHKPVPLISISTSEPMELVCMDYLCLELSKGGYSNILVITDHFTRYAVAIATRNQTAKLTAKVLFENFVVHYGFMSRLHSDQGRNFESEIVAHLCKLAGVEKSRTTPYHAMGNGMTERFNQSLLNMLGTLEEEQKKDWKTFVPSLVHAYNCTRHESTGYTPYELMFGRLPKLSIDVYLGVQGKKTGEEYCEYVEKLRQRLKYAYETASKQAGKSAERYKKAYDSRARESVLKQGDLVLVKRVAFSGKHKLEDRWEKDLYKVVNKPNSSIPVYVVERVNGKGPKRTLHRNLLLPYGGLPIEDPVSNTRFHSEQDPEGLKRKRERKGCSDSRQEQENQDESGDSDEDRYVEVEVEPKWVLDDLVVRDIEEQPEVESETQTGSTPDINGESDSESSDSSPVPVRRSARERKPPDRFVPHSLGNSVDRWDSKSKANFMMGVIGQCKEQNEKFCIQLLKFVKKS